MNCPDCGFTAKSPGGLASHRRSKHPRVPAPVSNAEALDVTLAELERNGRLGRRQAAQVGALRTMARALDSKPERAALWHEYAEELSALLDEHADDEETGKLLHGLGPQQQRNTA